MIEHENNQMEVDDENSTSDHLQKPRQIIGVRSNKTPKTAAERGREFRARIALLKQQSKQQQEPDAIVEIATEDSQVPGPSEIRTIEKRAKSAEATRRWRERKKGVRESSKRQAKTAAQRMREYREKKKLAKKILSKQKSDQDLDAIVGTSLSQMNQRAGPSTISSISSEPTRRGNSQSQQQIETSECRETRNDNINVESQSEGVTVASKPEVQCVELIPVTSIKPDEYLPEHTPSSSQTENSKSRPTPTLRRTHFGKVYCRTCLEPISALNQMVPLTIMDINFPTKSEAFRQKKEMETCRITKMIQVLMPDFDFDAAYNPIVCHKCVTKLEAAYVFMKVCRENEKLIQLYKSKFCPNVELVSCEDVAQNKSLLTEQNPPRKKQKTSKKHTSTKSAGDSLLEQCGSQLGPRGNAELVSDSRDEHFETVYTNSAGQENFAAETSMELCSSIKRETEDYGGYDRDSDFQINPEEVPSLVKEEIVVKEEAPCDPTDTLNTERTAQLDMDYHVKDEDCSQPHAPSISGIDDYHKNSPKYSPSNQKSQTFSRPKT